MQRIVLNFHGIGVPPTNVPADELPYWITAQEFRDFVAAAPDRAKQAGVDLLLTFDDGNKSDIEIAAPELAKVGIPALFFPCSGRIDQPGYLTADDIAELDRSGFTVGSHGVDHVPWNSIPQDGLDRELGVSRNRLSEVLGKPVTDAALPFGSYSRRVLSGLRRHGYTRVFSSDPGLSSKSVAFCRRCSYVKGADFDIASLVERFRKTQNVVIGELKTFLKSWR